VVWWSELGGAARDVVWWSRWMNAARTNVVGAVRDPPCTLQLACTTSCNSTAGPSDGECVHVVDLVCACMAIGRQTLGS